MRRVTNRRLQGVFVERVAAVPAAVLLHLDAVPIVGPVLHRDVVPPFADLARQRHLHSLVARHGLPYLMILVTRPAPTVRPPSRIAKRRPSSIAMGAMSSTVISVLSPGITISTPSGNAIDPVMSVGRK